MSSTSRNVLPHPQSRLCQTGPNHLQFASDTGIGAVLSKMDNEGVKHVEY